MDYEIVRRLARGGMGVVDLARGPDGRLVALKRLGLHGTAAEMQDARARFQRELAVLASLRHDAIVPLLDVVDDDGDIVLVMPYLDGGNLGEVLRTEGPLSTERVRAIASRLLPALAVAHRAGVIHRDIKPANVLFDSDGRAHLADFGVASTRDDTNGLTRTGMVVGTPGFLSPEQARGETVTAAADIAALGATLHFAATGRSPYEGGDAPAVLLRTSRAKASVDRDLDRDLRRMLVTMLDGRPERRPSAAALAGGASDTDPIPMVGRRQRPWLVVGSIAAALALVLGVRALTDDTGTIAAPVTTTTASTTTEAPCVPLPYRPCGGRNAPNTDGRACLGDHEDYDEVAANGCEAAPDDVDGSLLRDRLEATIVPRDDTDRYPLRVEDEGDLLCNNTLRLRLTAPAGTTLRLVLVDSRDRVLGEAVSADGVTGEIAVSDPRCFQSDSGDYAAVVTPTGTDRSAENYVLERSGSF
ncbi:protein kinase domain-containing protein [Actinospongicola halichondriae]|uniref:protein kinase domain-containing protein n=1 Tax=Actinospongicola halichondriae TaxID=3236844 RepID=UPI003D4AC01B